MRRLYLATSLQVLDDVLIGIVKLLFTFFKCLDIVCVFSERGPDGLIHKVRDTAIGLSGLQSQRTMQECIELDRDSFLGGVIHVAPLAG